MQYKGRLLVREGQTVGIYFPAKGGNLQPGLYDIMEIMGEICVKYIDKQAMSDARCNGITADELVEEIPYSCMTKEELSKL